MDGPQKNKKNSVDDIVGLLRSTWAIQQHNKAEYSLDRFCDQKLSGLLKTANALIFSVCSPAHSSCKCSRRVDVEQQEKNTQLECQLSDHTEPDFGGEKPFG